MRLASIIPGAAFRPSARQAAFLASQHPRRLLRAGNQVGKTATGRKKPGARPRLPSLEEGAPGPNVGLVVSADWQSYVDVISRGHVRDGAARDDLPIVFLLPSRGWKNRTIELENGSQILSGLPTRERQPSQVLRSTGFGSTSPRPRISGARR